MIIYPALDLRGGQVVRLQQGDPNRQTTYSSNPAEIGAKWVGMGARWLHIVNLDGTLGAANENETHVRALCKLGVPVQFGGGLRSAEDLARAFDLGVARVVLGTIAVQQPDQVAAWVTQYGAEKISVALDARDGFVATHGWQQVSAVTPADLGKRFAGMGVRHALYTDVSRDGELVGVNVAGTAELARATGLQVIASGGVGSLADVIALRETGAVAGVILGKAMYEGRIDVAAALKEAG
jgi:phosphoribosylformimino-5-aminoimidazole carboxamide ribotide isomerase